MTINRNDSEKQLIRVGHSPDSDDAFMFHALTNGKVDTGRYIFTHELVDIETLNRRAFRGELELTAVSAHAYAYLNDVYALCSCGASMGDKYGPIVVAPQKLTLSELKNKCIAVPGLLTTAFLALKLCLGAGIRYEVAPFDQIFDIVKRGEYNGVPIDAGLIIHEGQITYKKEGFELIVDLGVWWHEETGLPLPLGANAIRKDLNFPALTDVARLLKASIEYGLRNRHEALDYALKYGRGLARNDADTFVGMYVNDWTLDFGAVGRKAVEELLKRAYETGSVPKRVVPEFI
ncbi:MAG: ABC transporter substrate-binding protein [Planctomycetaceae bacterium]|jgi:1,4-dihydroxy-6-naphthoate synthase|nr:ABC transporter substrate-binding protein [Planctomycetaceae bacterium]